MTSKLASRYAKALFYSGSKDQREAIMQSLDAVIAAYDKFPKLKNLLELPEVTQLEKETLLKKIFGNYMNPFSLNFLILLLQKGRFQHLRDIATHYQQLYRESYGITKAFLTTPVPMDDPTKTMLKEKLEKAYGKTFLIINEINPKMIGGGILVIDEQMLDFSVRGRLNKLKIALLS